MKQKKRSLSVDSSVVAAVLCTVLLYTLRRCKSEYKQLSPFPEKWSQLVTGLGGMWRTEPNFTKQKLGSLKVPTTISDGDHDEIIKLEHTKRIAGEIPRAQLAIQHEVSHFAMLQNPTQFNKAVIDFLGA